QSIAGLRLPVLIKFDHLPQVNTARMQSEQLTCQSTDRVLPTSADPGQKVIRQLAAIQLSAAPPFVVVLPMTESEEPPISTSKPTSARVQFCSYPAAPRSKAPSPVTFLVTFDPRSSKR